MKKILLTVLLIFGLVFVLNSGADALPFPDPDHGFIGSDEFPDENIVEGSGMVSNIFNVTAGTEITFNYNLLTAEWGDAGPGEEPEGGIVNDYFGAMLFDTSTGTSVQTFTIADMYTNPFSVISGEAVGPHGSYFSHQTGVLSGSITITSTHTNVGLAFGVFDVEDNEVDTGVLLDNISGPVPFGGFEGGLIGTGGFIIQNEEDSMYGGNVHLLGGSEGSIAGVDTEGLTGQYAYMSTGPTEENGPPIVPEPISSTLFLIGGATLGFRRFRKNKN